MKKLLTVIGARPQFIKASAVSREIKKSSSYEEIILHTGQHFDKNMSEIFFDQLSIPKPDIQLDIHSSNHGDMTGRMLIEIEKAILQNRPDLVLVYGDTNSTLAGALAAVKLHVPVAHVEAGLRSFNRKMPEEINRILTDQVSDFLFCPTDNAIQNLQNEGFESGNAKIVKVGDVMQDAALFFAKKSVAPPDFKVRGDFILATLHRAENTDDPKRLKAIIESFNETHTSICPVVLPLHPRTAKMIKGQGLNLNVHTLDPVGYLEMLWLLDKSNLVLTDSGGVQKEAFFFGKYCVTLRDQTEWVELLNLKVNELVGANRKKIIDSVKRNIGKSVVDNQELYGGGKASVKIVKNLKEIN